MIEKTNRDSLSNRSSHKHTRNKKKGQNRNPLW